MEELLGNHEIEDVRWLCCLSESELEMVMSLKNMVIQRAKVIGHEELATKFDLKMLRALALVLMEYMKGKLKNLTHIPSLDGSSLLQCKLGDLLNIEELKTCIGIDENTNKATKRPHEAFVVKQKI